MPEKTGTSVLPDVGATAISARRITLLTVSYVPDGAQAQAVVEGL